MILFGSARGLQILLIFLTRRRPTRPVSVGVDAFSWRETRYSKLGGHNLPRRDITLKVL